LFRNRLHSRGLFLEFCGLVTAIVQTPVRVKKRTSEILRIFSGYCATKIGMIHSKQIRSTQNKQWGLRTHNVCKPLLLTSQKV
jgi:hypothetical protein